MRRVSASLTVVMLAASGHPVTPTTLRSWVYRGHITRGQGGYDLREILTYIEHRETRMDYQTGHTLNERGPVKTIIVTVAVPLEAIQGFLSAHGVDPDNVPCPGSININDGQVTIETYARDDHGQHIYNAKDNAMVREFVTVEQCAPWPADSAA